MESGKTGMDRSALIRGIKLVTLILGVMIVGTLGLIGYRLYFYNTDPAPTQQYENGATPAMVPAAPAPDIEYSRIPLGQPLGSTITQSIADGGRLYLTISGGGEPDRVIIVDVARGRIVSTIDLGNADSLPPRPRR